jgi:hypothetical protein
MNNSIGIALALTLIGSFALANGLAAPNSKSPGSATITAARMDACPYYPSPVVCRVGSTDREGN